MAYLFVFLSVAANTVKGYSGKKTSIFAVQPTDAPLFSFVRIFLCLIIGLIIVFVEGAHASLSVDPLMLGISAFSGITNAMFLFGWMLAVQKNPLVLVDVSLTLGSIIPAVLCLILFEENISFVKMIGFALILVAAVVLSLGAKSNKKISLLGILLVLIAAVGSGLTAFSQKLFDNFRTASGTFAEGIDYPKSVFLFYGYVFAALTLLICFCVFVLLQKKKNPEKKFSAKSLLAPVIKPLPHIIIMAVCLFADNYFKAVALIDYAMPSQILYPIIQGGCLITVNITASVFFKEKFTVKTLIGSAIALCGIIIMNVI